jgi:hypothetical protein
MQLGGKLPPDCLADAVARGANKSTFFLSFPQEISLLHSFYTVEPQFAVALIFPLLQSACS